MTANLIAPTLLSVPTPTTTKTSTNTNTNACTPYLPRRRYDGDFYAKNTTSDGSYLVGQMQLYDVGFASMYVQARAPTVGLWCAACGCACLWTVSQG